MHVRPWAYLICALAATFAPGQEPNEPRPTEIPSWFQVPPAMQRVLEATRSLGDWDHHAELLNESARQIFEHNGWDSESDLFVLEAAAEINEVPPWDVGGRIEAVRIVLGERYLLSDEQSIDLLRTMSSTAMGVMSRHMDPILTYTSEIISARAAGEPFTPEQVARWAKLMEPIVDDVHGTMMGGLKEYASQLDPEQRALLEADLEADARRFQDVREMLPQWAAGEWEPAHWGLEGDPIQSGEARAENSAGAPNSGGAGRPPRSPGEDRAPAASTGSDGDPDALEPEAAVESEQKTSEDDARRAPEAGGAALDPHPWAVHVRQFIARYKLDDPQQQRCWVYYKASRQRGDLVAQRQQRQIDAATQSGDPTALRAAREKLAAEQTGLFDRLKARLERVPTRAQRRAAEP